MSETLFKQTQLASISDEKPARMVISGFSDPQEKLLITGFAGGIKPSYQLMYSIGNSVFLNAFSQRLSMFQMVGVYVPASCEGDNATEIPEFFRFYRDHNIVTAGEPITIAINEITITGYIVELQIQDYSKDGIDGHKFTLPFLGKIDNLDIADDVFAQFGAEVDAIFGQFGAEVDAAFGQSAAQRNAAFGSRRTTASPSLAAYRYREDGPHPRLPPGTSVPPNDEDIAAARRAGVHI